MRQFRLEETKILRIPTNDHALVNLIPYDEKFELCGEITLGDLDLKGFSIKVQLRFGL